MSKKSWVKRWSLSPKQEVALRLLRGESDQPAAVLTQWRDEFLKGDMPALIMSPLLLSSSRPTH